MQTDRKWTEEAINRHLLAAVDALQPDIWDKLNLDIPQDMPEDVRDDAVHAGAAEPEPSAAYAEKTEITPFVEKRKSAAEASPSKIMRMYRRMRVAAMAAAASLALVLGGTGYHYYQNNRTESLVGLDVNPSIRLSVNRKDQVLKAEALNDDAEEILDGMNLKHVDMDIAVNALIGSMVRNGYLDQLDNAILVTVSSENSRKAGVVRKTVVGDIEQALTDHRVNAVVYNQEAEETGELQKLADEYGISYGKAYFLNELIQENGLDFAEMNKFSSMTMEEIAREISARSYKVGRQEKDADEVVTVTVPQESTAPAQTTEAESSSAAESAAAPSYAGETGHVRESLPAAAGTEQTQPAETKPEGDTGAGHGIKVEDADYHDGILDIYFERKVSWENPSISVTDQDGNSYPARITDTDDDRCQIAVTLPSEGGRFRFTVAGIRRQGSETETGTKKASTTVSGFFKAAEVAPGAEPNTWPETESDEETAGEKGDAASVSGGSAETAQPVSSQGQSAAQTQPGQDTGATSLPRQ